MKRTNLHVKFLAASRSLNAQYDRNAQLVEQLQRRERELGDSERARIDAQIVLKRAQETLKNTTDHLQRTLELLSQRNGMILQLRTALRTVLNSFEVV